MDPRLDLAAMVGRIAYHVVKEKLTNPRPTSLRAWERDLIARHGERLAQAGIRPPSADEAFLTYRQAMTHPTMMWLCVLGRHASQPVFQLHEVTVELVRRVCTAADDLDTLDAIP